ncbi:replication endonuclease [Halomonas korlensis]|uniref:Bacteriophage replication gene A protein (GPA) n=1 Tax=Halomonas korlensis TaxID=463301 RepID=A0A1I7J387_9GAMM|nr:replication endonuclease [Halomonas korlensis]SFU79658.1 Bacteriophage replication gene A protein (GPA) [Halomonas korlensis]
MRALEQSLQFGTHECRQWRATFFDALPGLAEDLAGGFVQVAKRHGNAAGNRWLARNAKGLIDPDRVYRRFAPIAGDLTRGFKALRNRETTTLEGIKAGCAWLESVQKRLTVGALNATHDDDALVRYAEAHARAVDDERNAIIGSIAEHNRRLRLGLLPPSPDKPRLEGDRLSDQARYLANVIAERRNPLTPPPFGIPLMAVFAWHRAPVMSLAVADELALAKARKRARLHGVEPPSLKTPSTVQLARLSCSLWWRRKLRRVAGRRLEQVQREAHRVHAQAGIYCSNMTIERRRQQKVRNRTLLETLEAINQEGQTYTLAELAELGLANPDHRRAELMLRIADTEAESRRIGHVGMFYTLTTPSRFHPVIANKRWDAKRKRNRYHCRRNPKYDGSTPREAQQHLQQTWAKARAKLAREGLAIYGIRVVEPHHDGTPHWHLLIWMKSEDEENVTEILRCHVEQDSPEELFDRRGNKTTARFDAKRIDFTKGTATGYVAKYISKNINGEQFDRAGVEDDHLDRYEHDLNEVAPRIEAWAAVWGIRQFQFVGLPSVTVWREVRRLTEKQADQLRQWEEATRPEPRAAARLHEIRQAANAGEWDKFLRLMGGPNLPRKDRPIRPWTVQRMDTGRAEFSHATGEERQGLEALGRYGEPVATTWGLVVSDGLGHESEYLTRLYRWEVRSKHHRSGAGSSGPDEVGAPWTCVTNCTERPRRDGQTTAPRVDTTPTKPSDEELARQIERYHQWRASEEVRAEMESVELETQLARAAARRLFEPPPIPEPEEFFPPELC